MLRRAFCRLLFDFDSTPESYVILDISRCRLGIG